MLVCHPHCYCVLLSVLPCPVPVPNPLPPPASHTQNPPIAHLCLAGEEPFGFIFRNPPHHIGSVLGYNLILFPNRALQWVTGMTSAGPTRPDHLPEGFQRELFTLYLQTHRLRNIPGVMNTCLDAFMRSSLT